MEITAELAPEGGPCTLDELGRDLALARALGVTYDLLLESLRYGVPGRPVTITVTIPEL